MKYKEGDKVRLVDNESVICSNGIPSSYAGSTGVIIRVHSSSYTIDCTKKGDSRIDRLSVNEYQIAGLLQKDWNKILEE